MASNADRQMAAAIDITTLKDSTSTASLRENCNTKCFDKEIEINADLNRAALDAGINLSNAERSKKCCSCALCCYCACKKSISRTKYSTEEAQKRRIKINYVAMCIYAFLTGTDFAVILPTLWDRLTQDFDAGGSYMGLVMSAYSFSGVICGLIMGKLSDSTHKSKPFLVIASLFSIFGHILSLMGINKYLLIFSRAL